MLLFHLSTVLFSSYATLLTLAHISLKGVIRVLSICASGSPLAAKTLLLHGISGTLKDILSGSGLVAGTTVSPTRPADQVIIALLSLGITHPHQRVDELTR